MIRSEYKASMFRLILKSILWGLLFESLFVAPLVIKEIRIFVIILLVIVIPFFLTMYVLLNKLVVRVTDFDVQFIRFGKPIESIPFENNEFARCTHTAKFKLELSSSPKYLRVIDGSGQVEDYSCNSLSQSDYERLVQEVIYISKDYQRRKHAEEVIALVLSSNTGVGEATGAMGVTSGAAWEANATMGGTGVAAEVAKAIMEITSASTGEEEIPEEPFSGAVFYFPKAEFSVMQKKRVKFELIFAGVITVLISILNPMFFSLFTSVSIETIIRQLLFTLALLFVFGIVSFLFWRQYKTQVDKTPDFIRITENELLIDDQKFSLSDIQMIKMTHEMYSSSDKSLLRTMKIIVTGKKRQYFLGHLYMWENCLQYKDYGKLCSSMNSFLKLNEKFVVFENV